MKKITLVLATFLLCCFTYAQNNSINYKAVVKDNLGNVIANQTVGVQFTIMANGSPVYVETQTPTTDSNGIIIVDIGSGTTVDVFTDIDWSTNTTLKTEIDISGGSAYTDMGTTEFKSVPYAINAGNTAFSTTTNITSNAPGDIDADDFVFGSTQLAHSGPDDTYNFRIFFDKSKGAFRAGSTRLATGDTFPYDGTAWNDINIGINSIALGYNTVARGQDSNAIGYGSEALGFGSAAIGYRAKAIGSSSNALGLDAQAQGFRSTAVGAFTLASGDHSTALGISTRAEAYESTAIGHYNTGGFVNQTASDPLNKLFEIGNGTFSVRSNAMTILQNGNTTINGQTTANEDTADAAIHALNGIKTHTGNSDAYGVYGQNTVTDYYGLGVTGKGGYIGVYGVTEPTGGLSYYGVYGQVNGSNTSGTNYGVYGTATSGIGATNYAVYASGDMAYTGSLIDASDRKLKTNIETLSNALASIKQLKPSSYLMQKSYQKIMNMSNKPEYGFIAQELQEVFPDLVSKNVHPGETKEAAPMEYLGVNYIGLIPILTKGIQEQQQEIEDLKAKVTSQDTIIQNLLVRMNALEQTEN